MRRLPRPLLPFAWTVLLLSLATHPARAQGGRAELMVLVTDSLGRPVRGAAVEVGGAAPPVLSDSMGAAYFGDLSAGDRIVSVRHPAYGEDAAVLRLPPASLVRWPVVLTSRAIALDTLQVVGERRTAFLQASGFYERRRQGMGRHVTREELERIPAMDLGPVFERMQGFRVEYGGAPGLPFVLRSGRGRRTIGESDCEPVVRIDGVRADRERLALLSPRDVEAIEGYPSAATAPAEFASGLGACGVVLVWLRR